MPKSTLVFFQKIRGQLYRNPKNKPFEVIAKGRSSWTRWFNLRRTDVSWRATYNTGRVIGVTKPDILIVMEVENRPTLLQYCKQVLEEKFNLVLPPSLKSPGKIMLSRLSEEP